MHEARAAARTSKAEREHAKYAHEKEAKNGYSLDMVVPRGLPTPGQYADRHQAHSQKRVPVSKCLPDRHRERHASRCKLAIEAPIIGEGTQN